MQRIVIVLCVLFATVSVSFATTYYIDYTGGNDTNNGTSKDTPWKRAPGMQGCSDNCAAYQAAHGSTDTTGAGNTFIFKGGVTWPNAVMSWDWNHGGGTAGNPITFTVDATWYTGGSWSRPIFDAESTPITADPITGITDMVRFYRGGAGHFVIDNLEFKGLAQSDDADAGTHMLNMQCTAFEVKNCYFHGWSHGGTASKEMVVLLYSNLSTTTDFASSIHGNVWDGSDTTEDMAKAYKGSAGHFYQNYVKGLYNGIIGYPRYVWGNTFIDIGETFDATGHGNVVESTGGQLIIYNNYISGADGGADIYHTPVDSLIDFDFNNVIVSEYNQAIQIGTDSLTTGTGSGIYVFNNTIQVADGETDTPINGPSKVGDALLPFMHVRDNHMIATNNTVNFGTQVADGGEVESNNIGQTNAQATTANYVSTSGYPYYPPYGGETVNTGTDLSAVCSAMTDSSPSLPATACRKDATLGVSYNSSTHTVTGDGRTAIARGPTWDIGAYEFRQMFAPWRTQ